jgi:outer membrane protein assembly factor BamE (lipoprotein component of BamABCDE complex)
VLATIVVLAGCVAQNRNHGYVPPEDVLSEIVVGVDTRDSVEETIGTPTAAGVLRDGGYYYVASKIRHYGALEPKVIERQLVAIRFDGADVVQGVERFGLEDGRTIVLQRRVTDNFTVDKTFLRQLLSNLGNFNPGQLLDQ